MEPAGRPILLHFVYHKITGLFWNFRENFRAKRDVPRKVIKCFTWNSEEANSSSGLDFMFEKWHIGPVKGDLKLKMSISPQTQQAGAFEVSLVAWGQETEGLWYLSAEDLASPEHERTRGKPCPWHSPSPDPWAIWGFRSRRHQYYRQREIAKGLIKFRVLLFYSEGK